MKIVVARYNEDISWTKAYDGVLIYNKGSPLGYTNERSLENCGREAHTYYTYICDNYDSLDDYTVFLQGKPFDHSPNVLQTLNRYLSATDKPSFEFISEEMTYSTFEQYSMSNKDCREILNTYERVFGVKPEPNHECIFGHGAQFIVSKEAILRRPKSFYENIVDILGYCIDPLEGYEIETFHKYIFTS